MPRGRRLPATIRAMRTLALIAALTGRAHAFCSLSIAPSMRVAMEGASRGSGVAGQHAHAHVAGWRMQECTPPAQTRIGTGTRVRIGTRPVRLGARRRLGETSRERLSSAPLGMGMSIHSSPLENSAKGQPNDSVLPFGINKGAVIAAAMALGSGFMAFAIEQGGTYVAVEALMKVTGTETVRSLLGFLSSWASTGDLTPVVVSAGVATMLQLLPLCNGILLMMTLGSMFGTLKGVAIASVAATSSAVMCMLISRSFLRERFEGKEPPLLKAVASSIASSRSKSMFVVTLFRLSPVVPYCWSNYLFGLTKVSLLPYVAGTWLGTLPAITAFVSAGVLTKNIAAGTASPPSALIALGAGATLAVLVTIGKISQHELSKMADTTDAEKRLDEAPCPS